MVSDHRPAVAAIATNHASHRDFLFINSCCLCTGTESSVGGKPVPKHLQMSIISPKQVGARPINAFQLLELPVSVNRFKIIIISINDRNIYLRICRFATHRMHQDKISVFSRQGPYNCPMRAKPASGRPRRHTSGRCTKRVRTEPKRRWLRPKRRAVRPECSERRNPNGDHVFRQARMIQNKVGNRFCLL